MIQDIRLIAEAEYGTFVLRESSVNISFAMHRAVRQFHQHPQHRHMEVKLKASDNLPVLIVDEDRFTQIITNLLCGAAATLTQGTPITLTAQIEQNENGMNELVLHLKYTSHAHPIVMADFSQQDLVKGEGRKEAGVPIVQTEAMCFALARMLIFLYDGELTVNATKNDIYRIFVRFPKNRLVW